MIVLKFLWRPASILVFGKKISHIRNFPSNALIALRIIDLANLSLEHFANTVCMKKQEPTAQYRAASHSVDNPMDCPLHVASCSLPFDAGRRRHSCLASDHKTRCVLTFRFCLEHAGNAENSPLQLSCAKHNSVMPRRFETRTT